MVLLAAVFEDEAHGICVRDIAGELFGDRGLFTSAIADQQLNQACGCRDCRRARRHAQAKSHWQEFGPWYGYIRNAHAHK